MNKNNKDISQKKVKAPKLTGEDGQSEKLEEKRIKLKKVIKPLFGKDVNDPPEIGDLTNLSTLLLYNNQLTGSIPSEIGNLTNLTYLNLGDNQLIGSIIPEIGNLTNLSTLLLYNNQLTGEIPESICSLTNLNWSSEWISFGYSYIYNNQLCPPYPSCIEDYVGEQDTTNCD